MVVVILLFALAVGDRLVKISALAHPRQTVSILWRILWYAPYMNTANPLSLPLSANVFLGLAIVVSLIAFVLAFRSGSRLMQFAFGLIIIGVLSNAYDRYAFGYVVDIFHVVNSLSFNLADIFLVSGVGLLVPALVLAP